MIRTLRKMAAAAVFVVAGAGLPQAQVPVVDTAAIAKAVQQLDQMMRDYQAQIDQLIHLRRQLESMTGDKAISGILNGVAERGEREAAESLSAIMRGAIAGTDIPGNASVLTVRIDELKTVFDLGDVAAFLSSDIPQDRALATQAGAGLAAIATAEDTYGRANAAMARINTLIDRIDENADLKASVDYNSRMLAEVAVLLNESLRIQAANANAVGTDALSAARDRARQRTFLRAGDG